jgi:RimJ/RimL family protein N-acetyltransferase
MRIDPLHLDDLAFFLEVRNECADCLHDDRVFGLSHALQWWKKNWGEDIVARISYKNPHGYFVLTSDNHELIGYARVSEHWSHRTVAVGVDIHKDHRRKGYAWETYQILFEKYFSEDKCRGIQIFNRIELEVLANNEPAITLYKKLGFKEEGIRRQAVRRGDRYIDSIVLIQALLQIRNI